MSKGTILYVGNFELPDKGAAANRVVSNGKLFQKLGYTPVYLGVRKSERFQGIKPLDSELHMYEEAYPQGSREWFMHMCSTKNICKMQKKYKDLRMVILYNVPFLLLCRVKMVFRKTNVKVVYDCTEWTGVTDGLLPKRIVKRLDEFFVRNFIGKVADALIVISRMMEKQYQKCKKMILLPPLVDINDSIWQQAREKSDDRFEFCFAGMLDGNKESLDSIVKAFALIEDKKSILRIIGVEREEFLAFYDGMNAIVEELADRIIFMGRLSHAETIAHVLNCDNYIFIRQSDRRNNAGFPTKFAESYTCGCDIITTDISDIRHYIKNNPRSQLLQTNSVKDIKKAMQAAMLCNRKKEKKLETTFHYETYLEKAKSWMEDFK